MLMICPERSCERRPYCPKGKIHEENKYCKERCSLQDEKMLRKPCIKAKGGSK